MDPDFWFKTKSKKYPMDKMKKKYPMDKINGAGLTGCMHVEECKLIYIFHTAQH